jgi:hypothetical protein
MSQNSEILSHLKTGRTITALEALKKFGTMRLAARIDELRIAGNNIHCDIVSVKTSRGTISRIGKYKLLTKGK